MEENLDINKEVNKERSDKTAKSNYEEIKDIKAEKDINVDINDGDSQSNSASKVAIKNEIPKAKIEKIARRMFCFILQFYVIWA